MLFLKDAYAQETRRMLNLQLSIDINNPTNLITAFLAIIQKADFQLDFLIQKPDFAFIIQNLAIELINVQNYVRLTITKLNQ